MPDRLLAFAFCALSQAPAALLCLALIGLLRRIGPRPFSSQSPLGRALLPTLGVAFAIQAVSMAGIGSSYEPISRVISVYPSSLAFYLVPKTMADRLPEPLLFLMGATSAMSLTWLGLLAIMATRVFFTRSRPSSAA